jgi:membrane protein YdbS with pleckstrin-like domain
MGAATHPETTEPAANKTPRRPRGWASLYALAFVLMLAAGATLVLAIRRFLESTRPLWVSIGLSAAAIVVSIVSVLLPRRR